METEYNANLWYINMAKPADIHIGMEGSFTLLVAIEEINEGDDFYEVGIRLLNRQQQETAHRRWGTTPPPVFGKQTE